MKAVPSRSQCCVIKINEEYSVRTRLCVPGSRGFEDARPDRSTSRHVEASGKPVDKGQSTGGTAVTLPDRFVGEQATCPWLRAAGTITR